MGQNVLDTKQRNLPEVSRAPLGEPKESPEMEGHEVVAKPEKPCPWDQESGGVCAMHGIPQGLLNGSAQTGLSRGTGCF